MPSQQLAQPTDGACLNCGEALHGAFCAACGQRSVPANPSVSELAGDAWHELSGFDGRIAATFRALLHPGRLTREYLAGRRARYLSPVRLYLSVSVIYFLIAAAAPTGAGGLRVELTQSDQGASRVLTAEERAEVLKQIDSSHWLLRPMLESIAEDPGEFRAQLFTTMPRVFFGMLPVFAAVVALFYRGRRFPAALVFAVHVHAVAFVIFMASELAKFSGSPLVAGVVGVIAAVVFVIYALRSLRAVFGGSWPATIAKAIGIGFGYLVLAGPAFFIVLIWASLV